MMSRRDALRSYRRAFKRAYGKVYRDPHIPEFDCMAFRGHRLQDVYGRTGNKSDWPIEVVDAMTSSDVEYLRNVDEEALPW